MILPPWLASIAAWSLLLAYVATGSSVIGGFYHYRDHLLLRDATGHEFRRAAGADRSPEFPSGSPVAT